MSRIINLAAAALILLMPAVPLAYADEPPYPKNLTWRLITEDEVKDITGSSQSLVHERTNAQPLFNAPNAPWDELKAVPNSQPVYVSVPSFWEAPPFPTIEPPLPKDLPKEIKDKLSEQKAKESSKPATFTDIPVDTYDNAPKADLRPKVRSLTDPLMKPDSKLPIPFSFRRYYAKDKEVFFQIACYCGSTSLEVERDYKTLKAAAPNRKIIDGIGSEAFLCMLENASFPEESKKDQDTNKKDAEEKRDIFADVLKEDRLKDPGFAEIAPIGTSSPELLDMGLMKAQKSPSFRMLAVADELPDGIEETVRDLYKLPKAADDKGEDSASANEKTNLDKDNAGDQEDGSEPDINENVLDEALPDGEINPFAKPVDLSAKKGVLVLIAYFPNKGVVCELAMDRRLGDPQSLLQIAMIVQNRLVNRW